MDQTFTNQARILAIAPTTRGFGYFLIEGREKVVAFGCKRAKGDGKNIESVSQAEKLLEQFQPNVLVLQNVNSKESHRVSRIKKLQQEFTELAKNGGIKVALFTGQQLRELLLNDPKSTRYAMAEVIAKLFPMELGDKLPLKRRAWDNENERMSMFDASGLAVAFGMQDK